METPDFDASLIERPPSAAVPERLSRWSIVTNAFRALELCLALLLVVWISAQLPLAVRISWHYFLLVIRFAAKPLVVFTLSNVIIAAVVAKSGRYSGRDSRQDDAVEGFYDEIVKLNENRPKSGLALGDEGDEEVVYQDKEVIVSEISNLSPASDNRDGSSTDSDSGSELEEIEHSKPYFRRTQSEKFLERKKRPAEEEEEGAKVFRRSETEKYRKMAISGGDLPEILAPEDELSSEEFQKTIEAFIAKQLRFRREESMAIVLHRN